MMTPMMMQRWRMHRKATAAPERTHSHRAVWSVCQRGGRRRRRREECRRRWSAAAAPGVPQQTRLEASLAVGGEMPSSHQQGRVRTSTHRLLRCTLLVVASGHTYA
jgi:hypothetical protein